MEADYMPMLAGALGHAEQLHDPSLKFWSALPGLFSATSNGKQLPSACAGLCVRGLSLSANPARPAQRGSAPRQPPGELLQDLKTAH